MPDIGSTLTLFRDVDLLCLDAGNTVVFLDHARLARACATAGFETTADALVRGRGAGQARARARAPCSTATGRSRALAVRAQLGRGSSGPCSTAPASRPERVPAMLDALWPQHRAMNLWSLVPDGLAAALDAARGAGVRVAVVSNSEGMLAQLLDDVGILGRSTWSSTAGSSASRSPTRASSASPSAHFRAPPARALHLGDNYGTDVLGARAAGVPVALVDPFGHLAGRHPDVPRVPGATEVAARSPWRARASGGGAGVRYVQAHRRHPGRRHRARGHRPGHARAGVLPGRARPPPDPLAPRSRRRALPARRHHLPRGGARPHRARGERRAPRAPSATRAFRRSSTPATSSSACASASISTRTSAPCAR